MQTAARNLSRWVELILVSVFLRERLSCPWGVEVQSCIVFVVVEERGTRRFASLLRGSSHASCCNMLQAVCSTKANNSQKQREEALCSQTCTRELSTRRLFLVLTKDLAACLIGVINGESCTFENSSFPTGTPL